jgi:repressor LexA
MLGYISADQPLKVPGESVEDVDVIEVSRDTVKEEGMYALKVRDNFLSNTAMINNGDILLMKQATVVNNGDMVALWFKEQEQVALRRYYNEEGRIRLQAANAAIPPLYVDPDKIEIQGKVVAVIRNIGQ